jgi:hypothetical protein
MARHTPAVLAVAGVLGLGMLGSCTSLPWAGVRTSTHTAAPYTVDVQTAASSITSWHTRDRPDLVGDLSFDPPPSADPDDGASGSPDLNDGAANYVLQVPPPPIPVPDLPNPFDVFDRLSPKQLAGDLLEALLTTIGDALLGAIRAFVDWALGLGVSSLNFVTRTPAAGTYDSTTVRSLWDFSRAVANAALALVVMWGGFGVMVKQATRSPYHDLVELLPRVILGALAVNLTLLFATLIIDANNALAAGVGQTGLPGYDQATPTQEGMAKVITALVYGVVAILLVLQMLMRLALIDLLIILSPVAVLCWVLPQTQGWFRWWTSLFPTTVFQQVIQLITLRLGAALMVELTPGSTDNALLTLFLGIAVCWLTLKVPALLRANAHRAGLSSVVSMVLISRTAGGLLTAGGAGGAAATGGGSAATAGPAAGARSLTPSSST